MMKRIDKRILTTTIVSLWYPGGWDIRASYTQHKLTIWHSEKFKSKIKLLRTNFPLERKERVVQTDKPVQLLK